jgi:hypothetical protein
MTERVRVAQQHAGELLAGRTVWMVNSTASGGGETAAGHTAERAAAAGGMVLLTLASAQFLMLVASNFARDQRPRTYGLVAPAGAIAVAAGPATLGSWGPGEVS